MSTLPRTIKNIWRVGIRDAFHQMNHISDTKAGTLVGIDTFGNKYFENMEDESPYRTRWVDFKGWHHDASQVEPGWYAWLSHMVVDPPGKDPSMSANLVPWQKKFLPNQSITRGAFKTYSTSKPAYEEWKPFVRPRSS